MTVVSDTSIITNLLQIGQVEILPAVFGGILIPEAVLEELSILDVQRQVVIQFSWLKVCPAQDIALVSELLQTIDIGEAEAIVLAIETHAEYLLMDERKGRGKAKELGIQVTGLLGVLLKAKSNGIISAVKPLMDDLISNSRFRVHHTVYHEVLRLAGE
ncbi:MAG: DUF3368 domain-containing protein [Saprospiraceae bacterium]